jgi:hypothetical protein
MKVGARPSPFLFFCLERGADLTKESTISDHGKKKLMNPTRSRGVNPRPQFLVECYMDIARAKAAEDGVPSNFTQSPLFSPTPSSRFSCMSPTNFPSESSLHPRKGGGNPGRILELC